MNSVCKTDSFKYLNFLSHNFGNKGIDDIVKGYAMKFVTLDAHDT
jgi:hypothetical protein